MNGFYLYQQIDYAHLSGVDKKVLGQLSALNAAGLNFELVPLPMSANAGRLYEIVRMITRRLPFSNMDPRWSFSQQYLSADFFYIRKPAYISYPMRKVLKEIKSRNPRAKAVMEIPTYPYDNEFRKNIREYPFLLKDRHNRLRLHGLVDKIALIGNETLAKLFGIDVVSFKNGIDLAEHPIREPIQDNTIDLCAVALFAKWHGYDRLLNGLLDYYLNGGKRDIKIHLVGEGPELAHYKDIAVHDLLKDRVLFYGHLTGDALNDVYNHADLGVTSLGNHRVGLHFSSDLKSRDYLAKGLPLITGCPIDVLDKERFNYFIEFPNDDSLISFDKVSDFYDITYGRGTPASQVALSIREYAAKTVDIHVTMRPVSEYFTG